MSTSMGRSKLYNPLTCLVKRCVTPVSCIALQRISHHKHLIALQTFNTDKLSSPSATGRKFSSQSKNGKTTILNDNRKLSSKSSKSTILGSTQDIINSALQKPAGPLYRNGKIMDPNHLNSHKDGDHATTTLIEPGHSDFFIPEVMLHDQDGRRRNRVLV